MPLWDKEAKVDTSPTGTARYVALYFPTSLLLGANSVNSAYVPLAIFPWRQLQDPHVRDGQPTAGTPGRDPNQSQVRHEGAQHTYRNRQAPGSRSRLLRLLMILDTFFAFLSHIVWRLYGFELCWCFEVFHFSFNTTSFVSSFCYLF